MAAGKSHPEKSQGPAVCLTNTFFVRLLIIFSFKNPNKVIFDLVEPLKKLGVMAEVLPEDYCHWNDDRMKYNVC